MNILNELKSRFEVAEPIFDYEIYDLGYTDSDIIDTLESNVFEELSGVDFVPCRIFYLVGYSDIFNLYERLDNTSTSIIFKYFVGNDFEYGYLDGFCSLNRLKLSNQICFSYTIKSCRAKKEFELSQVKILPESNNIDYKLTMCVNAFNNYRDAFDCSLDSAIVSIKSFLNVEQFDKFRKEIL